MSEQTPTPEQEAELVLFNEVYLRAFEEKCASHGLRFSSSEQVFKINMSAQHIKAAHAQKSETVVDEVYADLCKAMDIQTDKEKQAAVWEQTGQQAVDTIIKAALATLAADQ
jgi:hypothetical protein